MAGFSRRRRDDITAPPLAPPQGSRAGPRRTFLLGADRGQTALKTHATGRAQMLFPKMVTVGGSGPKALGIQIIPLGLERGKHRGKGHSSAGHRGGAIKATFSRSNPKRTSSPSRSPMEAGLSSIR